jgi:hypothetical protein
VFCFINFEKWLFEILYWLIFRFIFDFCRFILNFKFSSYALYFYLPERMFLRGQGGSQTWGWPKIVFSAIFVEGRQGYQMLFTGSKNIDPIPSYRNFKISKYIQLPCGRAFYSRLSQNLKFWHQKPISSYSFWVRDLKLGSYLLHIIPNNLFFSDFWIRSLFSKYADNYVLYTRDCDRKITIVSIIWN